MNRYFVAYQVERKSTPIPEIRRGEFLLENPIAGLDQIQEIEDVIRSTSGEDVTRVTVINFRGFDR